MFFSDFRCKVKCEDNQHGSGTPRICEAISEKPEEFQATPKMSAIAIATDPVTKFT